eukprot:GEMP01037119.1.p1 GENE.GEMP01037119.1~~GEMP01037119.1.p1  ORF type:complete len:382 (+),score=76.68 GEMP01037119.1:650-1795(+)
MGASFYRCGFCEGVPAGTQVPNCLKQTLHLPNHINNEKYTGQVYGSKTIIMTSTVLASPPTHSSFRPTTPIKTARPTLPTTTQYSPYNAEQRGSAHLAYRLHQSSSDVPTRKVLHLYSGNNPSSNSTNGADSKTLTSAAPNSKKDPRTAPTTMILPLQNVLPPVENGDAPFPTPPPVGAPTDHMMLHAGSNDEVHLENGESSILTPLPFAPPVFGITNNVDGHAGCSSRGGLLQDICAWDTVTSLTNTEDGSRCGDRNPTERTEDAGSDVVEKLQALDVLHAHIRAGQPLENIILAAQRVGRNPANQADPTTGDTSLHIAARHGQLQILKYLVTNLHAAVNTKNAKGMTALQISDHKGHDAQATFLRSFVAQSGRMRPKLE